jgi:Domain of unknown function (DUF4249)
MNQRNSKSIEDGDRLSRAEIAKLRFVYSIKKVIKRNLMQCFAAGIFLIAITSCEKVIDVDIDNASKKYVVEGNVSNIAGEQPEVRLSQTKNFSENNGFNGVSGAAVTIEVNGGIVYDLPETSSGVYKTSDFTGAPGNTYKLVVKISGNAFTAISTMPSQLVSLDALTVSNFSFGGNSSKIIAPDYLDPAGLGNSYRFIQYVNDAQIKAVIVQNDEQSDGLRITRPLRVADSDIKSGDIVRVTMQHIDPSAYKYWYSLDRAATGAGQSATPANPVTNIVGGALGYFSAHSISTKAISVP